MCSGRLRRRLQPVGLHSCVGAADFYNFAVYGGWQDGTWALRGGGSVSWNDLDTLRQVTAVALGGEQTSKYADKTHRASSRARTISAWSERLEPFANVAYVHVGGDVSEFPVSRRCGIDKFNATYTTLGAHSFYILPAGLTAQATLGWRYAFGDVTPVSTLGFQSGGSATRYIGSDRFKPRERNVRFTSISLKNPVFRRAR